MFLPIEVGWRERRSSDQVSPQVSLLFEVENLAVASPATVSRCGMVYTDYTDLGWKPYVQSWLEKRLKVRRELRSGRGSRVAYGTESKSRAPCRRVQAEAEPLQRMFEKFINKMLAFKKDYCNELVPLPEYSGIISLCKLYSALATPENGVRRDQSRARAGGARDLVGTTQGNRVSEAWFEHRRGWSRDPKGRPH